ncbi:MAG: glycosyl hydrolase family 28-related protein [Azospirillaceae bacterium]|nr:glycosyl hydrolase family 28-related protein [Azospirillaceae bacterium]
MTIISRVFLAIIALISLSGAAFAQGVTSFNGRTGAVAPQTGDYGISQISGVPSQSQASGWLDSAFCGTVGYVLARTTGSWVCSRNIPLNVVWFGADAGGVADSTTAIQTAMNAASTIGACVYVPNGTYLVSSITWPGLSSTTYPYFARPCLYGDGPGSRILQLSSFKSNNALVIGNGTLNDNGDGYVHDIAIESQVKKDSGAYIYAKGAARLKLQNIYIWKTVMLGIASSWMVSIFMPCQT